MYPQKLLGGRNRPALGIPYSFLLLFATELRIVAHDLRRFSEELDFLAD